jgi:hypothetical protein
MLNRRNLIYKWVTQMMLKTGNNKREMMESSGCRKQLPLI